MNSDSARIPVWFWPLPLLATLVVYGPTFGFGFLDFDDGMYIFENPFVRRGLTLEGLAYAFSFGDKPYFQPLVWLSFMLDVELFGVNPGRMHLVNTLLHGLNATLALALFGRATRIPAVGLGIGLLFAVHPAHVESVAWISERKDGLAGLFLLVFLLLYVRCVRTRSRLDHIAGLAALTLSLASKPFGVVAPALCLLLDFWPLGRFTEPGRSFNSLLKNGLSAHQGGCAGLSANTVCEQSVRVGKIHFCQPGVEKCQEGIFQHAVKTVCGERIKEKIPLIALCLAWSLLAILSSPRFGPDTATLAFPARVEAFLAVIFRYVGDFVYPRGPAVFHPHPGDIPLTTVLMAGGGILALGAGCFAARRSAPWLLVGWVWFLVALLPSSGLHRFGTWPFYADRFAYLPFLGLYLALATSVWEGLEALGRRLPAFDPQTRRAAFALTLTIPACLFALTARNFVGYWRDAQTLFARTIEVTGPNWLAYNNLAVALLKQGKNVEAAGALEQALSQEGGSAEIWHNLGLAYEKAGQDHKRRGDAHTAIALFVKALELNPRNADARNNLAVELFKLGRVAEAEAQLAEAIRLNPAEAAQHYNLGRLYALTGRMREAAASFAEAFRLKPDFVDAAGNLALALQLLGDGAGAERAAKRALAIDPTHAQSLKILESAAHKNTGAVNGTRSGQ